MPPFGEDNLMKLVGFRAVNGRSRVERGKSNKITAIIIAIDIFVIIATN